MHSGLGTLRFLCLAGTALPLLASAARAEYDVSAGPPRDVIANADFEPPQKGEGLDWIRLNSGEWLKGDIEGMRDDLMEFDSDELDSLSIDLGDVSGMVTEREFTLLFPDRVVVTGNVAMRDDVVKIRTADGVETFERESLLGMVQGIPTELNYWSGGMSLGLTARSGNTDQTEFTGLFDLRREDAFTRGTLNYNGAIGELDGTKSVDNHRVNLKFDYFVLPRFYITPLSVEAFKDSLQNLDLRVTPATGLGYHLIDRSRFSMDVELAAGYQYQAFIDAPPGDERITRTAAVIFRTDWDGDLTEKLEWSGEYRVQVGVPKVENTNHHFLTTLSFDLIWSLDFDLIFVWDRNETPQREADGTLPKRNDFRLTAGLGWDF